MTWMFACLSRSSRTAATTSGPSNVESAHSRVGDWRDATYFGRRLNSRAMVPSAFGQYAAKMS
ncbi:hypothetical protein BKA04_002150 [Cryobacterium mesophilum]|nr:hypothetical protein [Terrimesophilobacter mesophilus]